MAHSLLPVLLLLLPLLAAAQSDGDDCLFVDGRDGTCKPLPRCTELFQLLQASPSRQTIELLSRSNCGYQGKVPVVCCPQQKIQPSGFSSTDALPAPISEQPNDVSLHPRVGLLPFSECGHAENDRIIGGNETGLFEFPWMALLGYKTRDNKFYGFRCGGSLINGKYVLTAAHCIPNPHDPSGLKLSTIRLGEHDLRSPRDCEDNGLVCAPEPQDFEIEYAIAHPSFTKDKLQNDVGLVRIRGEAQFTETVKPICLPVGEEQQYMNPNKKRMIVAGWGVTETGTSSSKLLKVTVPVVPVQRCAAAYKRTSAVINIKQICAGGSEGRDSCAGDSGGPLMINENSNKGPVMVQYGIVSFGPKKCASEGYPGVYTRVAYYMDWILDNMQP
ncbi:CLIP domain-containing serine protease HP8-like [Schistocerca gregaria]|uniref:CLIP domain-containing serine protease HP8-like n=1 Tax=Schistocerca cancellata TaxID=274614 RepID=UPI0021198E75|nr:CLIP domain-containing serine protease HP8-like [Schistocerca cancellata]XP_049858667.1 CLIP domain-containing serine protease HP8-like [Schistocerca gregaria]